MHFHVFNGQGRSPLRGGHVMVLHAMYPGPVIDSDSG